MCQNHTVQLNEPKKVNANDTVQSNQKKDESIQPAVNGEKTLYEIMTEKKNGIMLVWGDNWQDNNHI